jgi:hypothetical protein
MPVSGLLAFARAPNATAASAAAAAVCTHPSRAAASDSESDQESEPYNAILQRHSVRLRTQARLFGKVSGVAQRSRLLRAGVVQRPTRTVARRSLAARASAHGP